MSRPRDGATELGLVALAAIWGINFSVVKAVLAHLDPLALNALRFPLAAGVLAVAMIRLPGPRLRREDRVPILLLGLLGNVVYQLAFILGINLTLAGNASLILATSPVWTVLLSMALGQEEPNRRVLSGSLLTLGGMALVVVGGGHALGWSGATIKGDLIMVAAAVLWSLYTVGAGGYVRRYGAIRVTAWTLWAGTPVLFVLGLPALTRTAWGAVPAWTWGGVAYAGVFSVGFAYLLWYRGVKRLGNSRTALYSNLVPVAALVTAWLWLGERPTPLQLAGAAVILTGISVARWGGARRQPGPSSLR